MYPLLKILNTDLIKEIYYYNNYSKLDMEWFKYLHKDKYDAVLMEIHSYFYRQKITEAWEGAGGVNHMMFNLYEQNKTIYNELLEYYLKGI